MSYITIDRNEPFQFGEHLVDIAHPLMLPSNSEIVNQTALQVFKEEVADYTYNYVYNDENTPPSSVLTVSTKHVGLDKTKLSNAPLLPLTQKNSSNSLNRFNLIDKNLPQRRPGDKCQTISLDEFCRLSASKDENSMSIDQKILSSANIFIKKARREKRFVPFDLTDKKFFATPWGDVYMAVEKLGEGVYKTAFKLNIVAKKALKGSQKAHNPRVILLERTSSAPTEDGLQFEKENERTINKYLYELSKVDDLKYISISRPIEMSDQNPGQINNSYWSLYACGKDLNQFLIQNPEANKAKSMLEMALGVAKIHSIGIVHRDLKIDNFLVFKGKVKVCDFGKAFHIGLTRIPPEYKMTFHLGWSPPEWMDKTSSRNDPSGDVFQLGVTFYHMLTKQNLENSFFRNLSPLNNLIKKIQGKGYDPEVLKKFTESDLKEISNVLKGIENIQNCSSQQDQVRVMFVLKTSPACWPKISELDPKFHKLVFNMLAADPSKRPSITEVVNELNKLTSS